MRQIETIEFFRAGSDQAIALMALPAVSRASPALVVCRSAGDECHARLLDEAVATARRADLRYRLAGLPVSGGALLVHSTLPASAELFARIGAASKGLDRLFIPDGGVLADSLSLLRATPVSTTEAADLAAWTALGAFVSIERTLEDHIGKPVSGASVLVQGAGAVGMALSELLSAAGAIVMISDERRERVRQAALLFGALPVAPERAALMKVDVFAPCGAHPLDEKLVRTIDASSVVPVGDGAVTSKAASMLHQRGVMCPPDFVVNAGAAIAATALRHGVARHAVEARVRAIADSVGNLLEVAKRTRVAPLEVAEALLAAPADMPVPEQLAALSS